LSIKGASEIPIDCPIASSGTQSWKSIYDEFGKATSGFMVCRKVWRQLLREGADVAHCTVERLMKKLGIQDVRRGRKCWTTIANDSRYRPTDKVNWQFTATRSNQLWVADITFIATWTGFVYVAFVTDVFARCIAGWKASRSLHTDLVQVFLLSLW